MNLSSETWGAITWLAIAVCFFFVGLTFWLQ